MPKAQQCYVTISVGGAGCQVGDLITRQYMGEHGIENDGTKPVSDTVNSRSFFEENSAGKLAPRSLMVDTDPNSLDAIQSKSWLAKDYHMGMLVEGTEDAGSNFAAGYYTTPKSLVKQVDEKLRKLVDNCDTLSGFIINNSVSGGTGSGLGALILERLSNDYRKTFKMGMHIYDSNSYDECVVAPYNELLATHYLMDHTDVSMVFDNVKLNDICMKKLGTDYPTMNDLNCVVAKAVSGITSRVRFPSSASLTDLSTNLVPFPRLHFMTCSLAPITKPQVSTSNVTIYEMMKLATDPTHMLVNYPNFSFEDKYLALSLNWRGDLKELDAREQAEKFKSAHVDRFADSVPMGIETVYSDGKPADSYNMATYDKELVGVGNNVAVSKFFKERMTKKFDLMYSQRAYVHLYTGESMEEGLFSEARENLGVLEKDYLDAVQPYVGSDGISEEDEFLIAKDKRVRQHVAAGPH